MLTSWKKYLIPNYLIRESLFVLSESGLNIESHISFVIRSLSL